MTQEVIQKLREFLLAENYELVLVSDFDEVPEENGKFCLLEGDSENQISYYLTGSTKSEAAGLIMKMKSSYLQLGFVIQLVSKFAEYNEAGKTGYFVSYTAREIVKAPECKTEFEPDFVKSVNGQRGDVFLDIPEKTTDLINDANFVDAVYVDEKISEIVIESGVKSVNGMTGDVSLFIPEKVSDLKNDSNFISKQEAENEFAKKGDVPTDVYTKGQIDQKFVQTDQRIANVSTNVQNVSTKLNNEVNRLDQRIANVSSNIPTDYVKKTDYAKDEAAQNQTLKTYSDGKVSDLQSYVETNFAKKGEAPTDVYTKQEADDKFQVKGDYATKTELGELDDKIDEVEAKIPTDYVSEEDFGQFVESQAATDLAQNKDISEIETVLEETNKVIKNNIPASTLSLDDETKDLPTNLQSLIDYKAAYNEEVYAKKEDLNEAETKISENTENIAQNEAKLVDLSTYTRRELEAHTGQINSVSERVQTIEDDYVVSDDIKDFAKKSDIPTDYVKESAYQIKIQEIESEISGKVENSDFVDYKATQKNVDDKQTEDIAANSQIIESVSGRVQTIESDYVKSEDISGFVDSAFVEEETSKTLNSAKSYTDGQIEFLDADVSSKISKLNVSINNEFNRIWAENYVKHDEISDFATKQEVKDVVDKIPTDVVKHDEISDFVTNSSVSVNYAKKSEVQAVDSKLADYIKTDDAEAKFQPIGDYAKKSEITDFITSEEAAETYATNEKVDGLVTGVSSVNGMSGEVVIKTTSTDYVDLEIKNTKDWVSENYQEAGDYATKQEVETVDSKFAEYLKSSDAEATYQKIGDYATNERVNQVEAEIPNDVVSHDEIADFVTDSSVKENYATKQEVQTVSGKIDQVEADYVEADKVLDNKIGSNTGQINEVSDRVSAIESDYVVSDQIKDFVTNSSVSINYAKKSDLDELKLFKFPNVTIIGEPSINNGQISRFSANDYLEFPFLVNFRDRGFEIEFEIKTGSNVISQENILDSDYGLAFAVRNSRFVLAVSTNGTSWTLGELIGEHNVQPETNYRIKISYDRLTYKIWYKTDWLADYTLDASNIAANQSPFPKQMYIGVGGVNSTAKNAFSGIINLNYAKLFINNELVWQGMDDVGLATRLAVDMSNIDEAGEQKVKDIIATEGYLKEIPENDFATRSELNSSIANVSNWVSTNYAKKIQLEDYLLKSDAQDNYAGKTQFEALYNHVHDDLDEEITDLYKADQEINGKLGKIDVSISTLNSSVNQIEKAGFLTSSDKTELENLISVKQDAGDYAEKSFVTDEINKLNIADYLKKSEAETTYEKIGRYDDIVSTLNSSVNKIEKAGYATETWVQNQNYLGNSDKTELTNLINGKQDSGDYATNDRVNQVENLISEKVDADFVNGKFDTLNSSVNQHFQVKGDYATKSELADYYLKSNGEALENRVGTVENDVNTLKNAGYLNKTTADGYYYDKSSGKSLAGQIANKQDKLVSSGENQNIKTINGNDILGSGNIEIQGGGVDEKYVQDKITELSTQISTEYTKDSDFQPVKQKVDSIDLNNYYTSGQTDSLLTDKQDKLVSSGENQNIKTINGKDILGTGDIEIQGGGGNHQNITYEEWLALSDEEKMEDKVYIITDADQLKLTNVIFEYNSVTKTLNIIS